MFPRRASAINLLTGALLVGSLLLVFGYDWKNRKPPPVDSSGESQTLEVRFAQENASPPEPQKRLRLAVIYPAGGKVWDDMGKLLGDLGEGYLFNSLDEKTLLTDPNLLDRSRFDVVFLTCSNGGKEYKDRLFRFVNEGGILYASDHRFAALASAFPDFFDQKLLAVGSNQVVVADVQEPDLRQAIGKTIELNFDQTGWVTAPFAGKGVTTLVHGTIRKDKSNETVWAPLLVKFNVGKGTVFFTSFHNAKINNETAQKLLKYLVFRLFTTDADAQVNTTIQERGFSTAQSNLLGMVREAPPFDGKYHHEKAGLLFFALGFRNEGAKLALTIRSPDGKSFRWEGNSTVVLEVPQAVAGDWSYTVTPLTVPYSNFPYFVRVGPRK